MHYKKKAERFGKYFANILERLEYHSWNGNEFVLSKDLPSRESSDFAIERQKMIVEGEFIGQLNPFLAYITVEEGFEDTLMNEIYVKGKMIFKDKARSIGVLTDDSGYRIEMTGLQRMAERERWVYSFKTIANEISKALDKIRFVEI